MPIETQADEPTAELLDLPITADKDAPEVVFNLTRPNAETQNGRAKAGIPAGISFPEELLAAAGEARKPASSSDDPLDALFGAPAEAEPATPETPPPPISHEHPV